MSHGTVTCPSWHIGPIEPAKHILPDNINIADKTLLFFNIFFSLNDGSLKKHSYADILQK